MPILYVPHHRVRGLHCSICSTKEEQQNSPEKQVGGYFWLKISLSFYGILEIESLSNQKIWAP